MKKLLIAAIVMAMVVIFGGCSQNPSRIQDSRQQIDELNSIIENQNEEINDLSEQNEGLTAEVSQLMSQIEEYEIGALEEAAPEE